MEKEKVKHLNRVVAVSVALVSTFMAVSKVKDDNVVQGMLQAKTDALDTWNEYQAKRLKHHLAENSIAQYDALKLLLPAPAAKTLEDRSAKLRADVQRYEGEEKVLSQRAKASEAKYEALNFVDDQFDLSDAAFSIALMFLAVSALTAEVWLLRASWCVGAVGLLFGVAGFAGWTIHPDWLIRFLT